MFKPPGTLKAVCYGNEPLLGSNGYDRLHHTVLTITGVAGIADTTTFICLVQNPIITGDKEKQVAVVALHIFTKLLKFVKDKEFIRLLL